MWPPANESGSWINPVNNSVSLAVVTHRNRYDFTLNSPQQQCHCVTVDIYEIKAPEVMSLVQSRTKYGHREELRPEHE